MRGIKKVPIAGKSREEWLEMRRHTIGGSDAAGIIGLSKWSSPMSVWADKTGRLPDKPDTEAMRLGRDLEGYVARRWMETTGKKVRRLNSMLYNELYPFAHADIDREVIGERAGLECKTTSTLDVKQFQGLEFPEQYYAQCVHYLAVTGYDRWYLSVLLFGREGLLQEWSGIKEQMEALKGRKEEIENTIKLDLKEAERGACTGYGISWKPQSRRSFQTAAFEKAHPNIDLSPFYKTSEARVLRITAEKEAI